MNFTVGDISGNATRIISICHGLENNYDCRLVVFPELSLTGYPPEDLLLRDDFIAEVERELGRIVDAIGEVTAIIGHPYRHFDRLFNAVSVLSQGQIIERYYKRRLPNYSVFDEKRYFSSGDRPCVVELNGVRIGLTICEDIWHDGPVEGSAAAGAEIVININASPFSIDKADQRETHVVSKRAKQNELPILYLNMVGGQDELVFDGGSFVCDQSGNITHRAKFFDEDFLKVDFDKKITPCRATICPMPDTEERVYQALVTGVRDYVRKNRFSGAVIGLSGGIDSALTLAIAVDALGADNVQAVMMPSRYTRSISTEDAISEAQILGVNYRIIDIDPLFELFLDQLAPVFEGSEPDTSEENLQARIRGTLLMAISNKTGSMVLATGNKSEMAVGYATLYGDMAGGFSVIKDVPKTLVYGLVRYRNSINLAVPERVLHRAPSAELAFGQEDQQTLPSYQILDAILKAYIEEDKTIVDIVQDGFNEITVRDVVRRVKLSEYKRRQAAPGVRISQRAFGRDRRYPITSAFL